MRPPARDDLRGTGRISSGAVGPAEGDQQHRRRPRRSSRDRTARARCRPARGVLDRRLRQDAVAEVEDVAGPAGRAAEDRPSRAARISPGGARSTAGSRLPCTATSWPEPPPTPASRSTRQSRPITSPPAARIEGRSAAVPVPKWMTGAPGVSAADERARVRQHERAVVVGRQHADPASRRAARPRRRRRSGR